MALFVGLGVLMTVGTIVPSEFLKIGLKFLISGSIGFLFGPVSGILGAVAIDLIGYIVRPTGPYFFGFTFNEIIVGLIYGVILYKKPISLWRVALSKALVSIIVNILLSTLWLSMLYGKAFYVLLPARAIKNLISFPLEVALLLLTLKGVERVRRLSVRKN